MRDILITNKSTLSTHLQVNHFYKLSVMSQVFSTDTKINVKKKVDKEAIVENLDNTASFKSIVSSIGVRRGKGKRALPTFVNYTARRRSLPSSYFAFTDFLYPSQPRYSFSQDWDGGLNPGYFENLQFKSLMPWMITPVQYLERPDPVTDLLSQKHTWNCLWSSFINCCGMKRTKIQHLKQFGEEVLCCPKAYVDMAVHYENNPDNFFSDIYNWYYAGEGNMLVAQLDGSHYIIRSYFDCLYVSPFFTDTLSIDYANEVTYKCAAESNILETIHSMHFIALRTKLKVIILKLVTDEMPLKVQKLKEMDSELPFTSIKFDKFHKNILYVTTLDYNLTIVNLDRMAGRSKKLRGKFTSLVDNWSEVVAEERTNYAHVTRSSIVLYDKRTNEPYQRWKTFKCITDVQSCTQISAVKYSDRKPLMYVATDHHLFLMDMRCGKTKDDKMKPLQRWSHGMMSTPTYLDICAYGRENNKELVCLSSQWFEDLCVVSNYSNTLTRTDDINGVSLPYRPPSLMQTLNEAHRKKLCYSLYDEIHNRLCTSITGLVSLDQGDSCSVLMQNSIGDISCHAMYPRHMHAFIEDDSIEKLHEWCKQYKPEKRPLEVSNVINIRTFLRNLQEAPKDFVPGKNMVIKPKSNFDENEIREIFDEGNLEPEFLDIWKEKDHDITLDQTGATQFFVD